MTTYNDPQLGQAFSNLASVFAPPSGSDLSGYATAKATREKAQRLADLFAYSQGAGFDQTTFDRMNEAAGNWVPTQSYYAVDKNSADTRRGQDITAATSRANNKDDNARALETNRADNQRAVVTGAFQPLSQGQVRPEMPAEIAAIFGLPQLPQVAGQDKPLTDAEAKGAAFAAMTPEEQHAAVASDIPIEQIVMGGKPKIVRRSDAVGQEPFVKDTTKANGLAQLKDGTRVAAVQGPDGRWYNAQTKDVLPPDVEIFDTPKPTGTSEQVGLNLGKPSEFTTKNGIFAVRAGQADAILNGAPPAGSPPGTPNTPYTPNMKDFELMLGGVGDAMPLSMSNALVSPEGRNFYNAAMGFMMSVLRPDTGAAFGKKEFQDYAKVFIPIPGDDPETIKNKAIARQTALAALQGTSNGAAEAIVRLMMAQGVPVPDEMLAHMQAAKQAAAQGGAPAPVPGAPPAAAPSAAAPPAPGEPVKVTSPEEARKLPKGTKIILPDGSTGTVP